MSRIFDGDGVLFTSLSDYNREKAQKLFHCLTENLRVLGCRFFEVDVEFWPSPKNCWVVWVQLGKPWGAWPEWLDWIRRRLSDLALEGSDRFYEMGAWAIPQITIDSRTMLNGCKRFRVVVYEDIPFLVSYDGKYHEAGDFARHDLKHEHYELQRATRDNRQVHEQQAKVQELEATMRQTYTWERIDSLAGK
ncbi:hypothetical protein ASPVEDRAFT_875910 [Aspergillus versicolor CBS 583.65]|uniref:Uncharacterized protein n=1 Tax=Aspergillus versicolor CBS 583.65 TaxID=1036611 RepID=A0A1L9PZ27_ASPVE|nr:uncharacterized protein ASPVEDRAFT_875910 [Aspergillus versicolor CBS 583.65]OJJ06715.1 hypothetical protein ASPVEDRAFT_875910 [Aspergillus versicolor CBS 583.65]